MVVRQREEKAKVFCIGFHKTGTSSMAAALTRLGYRVAGPFGTRDPDIRETAAGRAMKLVPEFDAFQDNPWAVLSLFQPVEAGQRA